MYGLLLALWRRIGGAAAAGLWERPTSAVPDGQVFVPLFRTGNRWLVPPWHHAIVRTRFMKHEQERPDSDGPYGYDPRDQHLAD
jgi:hypothetical protein